MYDAIYLASNEEMSKLKGRKALILLTDGVDNGSKETLADAIEAAQRADTMVYAIYYKGDEQRPANNNGMNQGGRNRGGMGGGFPGGGYPGGGYPGGGGGGYPGGGGNRAPSQQARADGKKILERITKETGGALFEVSKKQDVDSIYKEIEEELRSQYRIGYTPTDLSNGYHRLQLTVKQSGFKVQTRDGYYIGQQ
jgi:VWFA-related protein